MTTSSLTRSSQPPPPPLPETRSPGASLSVSPRATDGGCGGVRLALARDDSGPGTRASGSLPPLLPASLLSSLSSLSSLPLTSLGNRPLGELGAAPPGNLRPLRGSHSAHWETGPTPSGAPAGVLQGMVSALLLEPQLCVVCRHVEAEQSTRAERSSPAGTKSPRVVSCVCLSDGGSTTESGKAYSRAGVGLVRDRTTWQM